MLYVKSVLLTLPVFHAWSPSLVEGWYDPPGVPKLGVRALRNKDQREKDQRFAIKTGLDE